MKNILKLHNLVLLNVLFVASGANAESDGDDFFKKETLYPFAVSNITGEKPQSKLWKFDNKWWAVMPTQDGSFVWRLNGKTWTKTTKIASSNFSKSFADCKRVEDVTHVFLLNGAESKLVSLRYNFEKRSYVFWQERKTDSKISLSSDTEMATIDIDSNKKMWLVYDGKDTISVRSSEFPYNRWNTPMQLAKGLNKDDIATISRVGQKDIGVFWSNQITHQFGFRLHHDEDKDSIWSKDELANYKGSGATPSNSKFADDHMHMTSSSNGDVFVAMKTSFNGGVFPKVGFLKRRANGVWEPLYEIASNATKQDGSRPIVVISEELNRLFVIFTSSSADGDILMRQSRMDKIKFSETSTLLRGRLNNVTSTKDGVGTSFVIMAGTGKITNSAKIRLLEEESN